VMLSQKINMGIQDRVEETGRHAYVQKTE